MMFLHLYTLISLNKILCFTFFGFFIQQIFKFIATVKLKKIFTFPTTNQTTDSIMAFVAGLSIYKVTTIIQKDVHGLEIDEQEEAKRIIGNLVLGIKIPFRYYFAIISMCLVSRLAYVLEFNENIGPLFRILQKSTKVFFSFFIIYAYLVLILGLVGNISFLGINDQYRTFYESILTIIDASMGNFELNRKDDPNMDNVQTN